MYIQHIPNGNPGVHPRLTVTPIYSEKHFRDVGDTVQFGGKGPLKSDNPNHQRYVRKVQRGVEDWLKKFKSPREFETTEDGKNIKIPYEQIDMPEFRRGSNQPGVGQGEGQEGDEVGEVGPDGQPQSGKGSEAGDGPGKPGDQPGDKGDGDTGDDGEGNGDQAGQGSNDMSKDDYTMEFSRTEIAKWFGKDLQLPNFEDRGKNNIQDIEFKLRSISRRGTPGRIHPRRTLLQTLIRRGQELLNAGDKKPSEKKEVIHPNDVRFRHFKEQPIPKHQAVIFYILDTSGSMSDEKKGWSRDINWYLSTFIKAEYGNKNKELLSSQFRKDIPVKKDMFGEGVEEKFIIHDSDAEEVSEENFYTGSKGGGTEFAVAYQYILRQIEEKYDPKDWNIYIFQYTDGEDWGNDTNQTIKTMRELIDKGVNLIGYVETESRGYSRETFANKLERFMADEDKYKTKFRMSQLDSGEPEQYMRVVHDLLGKDKNKR